MTPIFDWLFSYHQMTRALVIAALLLGWQVRGWVDRRRTRESVAIPTAPCVHCKGTGHPQPWAEATWLGECGNCKGRGQVRI